MNTDKNSQRPWYKEPWPWVAIAIPGLAVIMGITTLVLAISNPDPVIVDEQKYREITSELKAQAGEEATGSQQGDAGDSSDGAH